MESKNLRDAARVGATAGSHHTRAAFMTICVLFVGGLLFLVVFYGIFCFKTWRAGRSAASWRDAPKVERVVEDGVRWRSPDGRLSWKDASPILSLGGRRMTLVDNDSGKEVFHLRSEGRLLSGEWREDSRAFAVEHLVSGAHDVTLLLIEDNTVTRHEVSDVIDPASLLPDHDRNLPQRWEHSAGLIGFQSDGDVQIWWQGTATFLADNEPVRTTTRLHRFTIGWSAKREFFVAQVFELARPKNEVLQP